MNDELIHDENARALPRLTAAKLADFVVALLVIIATIVYFLTR